MHPAPSPTGILFVDKPAGMTSHAVVSRVRRWFGTKKVGHAGTLDPMATGLLVLGLGRGTKLLTYIVGADKTYHATIRFGSSTPTDDADSDPDRFAAHEALSAVDDAAIERALASLRGDIEQVPSAVSAIKVDGKRSYARVRAGEDVELQPRPVTILRFDVIGQPRRGDGWVDVDVVVECTSGAYVRALARDAGQFLGVGGHLTALRRVRVGEWGVERGIGLPEDLAAVPPPQLTPLAQAAADVLPTVDVERECARDLLQGKLVDLQGAPRGRCAVVSHDELIAVVEPRGGQYKTATGIALNN